MRNEKILFEMNESKKHNISKLTRYSSSRLAEKFIAINTYIKK